MADRRARYRLGACDVFALALHEVTGWPLALVEGVRPDPDPYAAGESLVEAAHAVALAPSGQLADVDGLHPRGDLLARCCFTARPKRVRVRRVSPAECAETFTTEPLDTRALAAAVAFIRKTPARWTLPGAGALLANQPS